MANSNRLAKRYLAELANSPQDLHSQSFEGLLRYLDANSPLHERLGYSISLKQDGFRLGQQPLLHFHGSAFCDVVEKQSTGLYKLKNVYWGLFGVNGPLPTHLTEHAIERECRYKDSTLTEFCDLFHHRFLSFFYRAWADAQPAISHDFSFAKNDLFAQRVAVFAGATAKRDKKSLTSSAKVHSPIGSVSSLPATIESSFETRFKTEPEHLDTYLAGLFSLKNRSSGVLQQTLQSYLGHPIKIREFVGRWYDIPEQEYSLLGRSNNQLGRTSVVGKSSFQRSFDIAIDIGPLNFADYSKMIDEKHHFKVIRRLVNKALGSEFTVTLHLILSAAQKQNTTLGNNTLGINSWLLSNIDDKPSDQPNFNNEPQVVYSRVC